MAKSKSVPRNEDERVAPLRYHSRGGDVRRNIDNFTCGSQLIGHRLFIWKSGGLIPVYIWFALFIVAFWSHLYTTLGPDDLQLIIMRIGSSLNSLIGANELRLINLTVDLYDVRSVPIGSVPFVPEVALVWGKAMRGLIRSLIFSVTLSVPLSIAFVRFANWEGKGAMNGHHERGSLLVTSDVHPAHFLAPCAYDCFFLRNTPRDPRRFSMRACTLG